MTEQRYEQFKRIMKDYNLYSSEGFILLNRIDNFLNEHKDIVKVLKEYLEFNKTCPFNIDEPVIDQAGKCYLIKSIELRPVDGILQYTKLDVIDSKGKTRTFRIDEVKRFNKQMQEIVD